MWTLAAAEHRVLIHGHRGARAVLPENTLPAFEHAIEAGADYLELDVVVTRDDVPVVSHDPVLNEAICTGAGGTRVVREMTLAEVRRWDCGSLTNPAFPNQRPVPGARIPTLEEVLALAARGRFGFNVELKTAAGRPELTPAPERFAELVLGAIKKHRLEQRTIIQSFDYALLHAVKRSGSGIRLAALFSRGGDLIAEVRAAHADMASPHLSLVTPERVKEAQTLGIRVAAWTANDPAEWDRLIAAGVDAIITDDPGALVAHLARRP